jgi:hypothetical protein
VQFTLPQLRKLYETVMGVKLSKATFRRKGSRRKGSSGHPRQAEAPIAAQLYRLSDHLKDFLPGGAQMR